MELDCFAFVECGGGGKGFVEEPAVVVVEAEFRTNAWHMVGDSVFCKSALLIFCWFEKLFVLWLE